jgi:uroporphyrinogen decarboxylase
MGRTMTPKERVLTAFARQEPDRVPINYLANPGIDARLKVHYGIAPEDAEGLRQALGVDFRAVHAAYRGPALHVDIEGRHVDPLWGFHTRYIEHETGAYWDYCDFPLRDADLETVASWPLPSPDDYDYRGIRDACARLAPFAINGAAGFGDIINGNGFLRGMEQTLVDLITDDPAGLLLADRRMQVQLEVTARTLEAAQGGVDFLWLGEDLGTQGGPLISLEVFRKHIRPRFEPFCDLARSHNIPVMIHCCGSSSWAFDDFAEMGIGVVDTLQPEAKDMAPTYLKQTYGDRLAFHGCISTAGPVAFGTPDDTRAYCRKTLEIMMPGGGYCFAPTHQLQDNSPTANVLAMYETAHTVGRY